MTKIIVASSYCLKLAQLPEEIEKHYKNHKFSYIKGKWVAIRNLVKGKHAKKFRNKPA